MGYVIASESRQEDELLFLVDRSKQRASFWSDRLDDVLVFADKAAALRKAGTLRYNEPQVMSLQEAREYMRDAQVERDHEAAMDEAESGWDAHKMF